MISIFDVGDKVMVYIFAIYVGKGIIVKGEKEEYSVQFFGTNNVISGLLPHQLKLIKESEKE